MIEEVRKLWWRWASPLKTARLALHEQRWLDAVHHYVRLRRHNPDDWRGREDEGLLLVPDAGEILYRLK